MLTVGGMSGRTQPLSHVPGLLDLAEAQLGIVARTQLRQLGVSRDHEHNQIRAQRWSRPTSRVVALLTGALDREQWMWVGLLHGGDASRLCALSALEAHGFMGWEPGLTQVEVPHGRKVPTTDGLAIHHSRGFAVAPTVVRRGLRCQTAARAVVMAADSIPSERRALGLVLAAVQQRIVLPDEIGENLGRTSRHAPAIRSVLAHAAEGADSLREVDLTALVGRAGFTSYRRQVTIPTPEGPRPYDVGVDLADGTLLLLESDGVHHLGLERRDADVAKDAAAIALGHQVMRVPVQVIGSHEGRLLQQLMRIRAAAEERARSRRRW